MYNQKKIKLVLARSDKHFDIGKKLFIEYSQTLDFDLCFQDFENELKTIKQQYNQSKGGLILLNYKNLFIGCVGIRKFKNEIVELKRMYIKNEYRGLGFGKILLNEAIKLSRELNYNKIRLDTLDSMKSAISLYQDAGFKEIQSYRYNPHQGVKYFELDISE